MIRFRLGVAAALGMMTVIPSPAAHAQAPSAADAAAADALYDEADRLMGQGKYAEACPKFAESYRIDPATGALLALAACYEKGGKLASAWTTYRQVVARALREKDTERAEASRARVAELEPRLPRMAVRISPEVGLIAGLEVLRDGTRIDVDTASTAVPVDAGEHTVTARAPHRIATTKSVAAVEGKTVEVVIDALMQGPDGSAAPTTRPPDEGDGGGLSTLQVVGIGTASVGVVGLALGSVFGITALGTASDLDDHGYDADAGTCTKAADECPGLYDDASSQGTLSTIFFVSGAVLAGAGAVMIIVGGNGDGGAASDAGLVLAPALGGAVLKGSM